MGWRLCLASCWISRRKTKTKQQQLGLGSNLTSSQRKFESLCTTDVREPRFRLGWARARVLHKPVNFGHEKTYKNTEQKMPKPVLIYKRWGLNFPRTDTQTVPVREAMHQYRPNEARHTSCDSAHFEGAIPWSACVSASMCIVERDTCDRC